MIESPTDLAGTKLALVKAASELFAERGFEAVSVRDITGQADVNLASVTYHFGSKEGLIDAVFINHITPINEERLARFDRLPEEKYTVRTLLEAFFEPLINRIQGSPLNEQLFGKLVGRMVSERAYEMPEVILAQFRTIASHYVPAFQKVVPGLSPADVLWRIHFSFGVVAHTLMHCEILNKVTDGLVTDESLEGKFERILSFCEAGFLKGGAA